MSIFAVNMNHSATLCPLFNDETMKKFKESNRQKEQAAKKHDVKVLIACVAVLEHLIFYVVDAPSQSAVEEYLKEVGLAFYNNIQIREVQLLEEVLKRYKIT
jgi:hypothetical protein